MKRMVSPESRMIASGGTVSQWNHLAPVEYCPSGWRRSALGLEEIPFICPTGALATWSSPAHRALVQCLDGQPGGGNRTLLPVGLRVGAHRCGADHQPVLHLRE